MRFLPHPLLALLAAALLPAPAFAANPQSWVAGVGDDANLCGYSDPCLTFAAAVAATDPDGVVTANSPGDFGPFTATQGVTIDGTGAQAVVLAATGDGIVVNAPGKDVVLRDLDLQWGAGGPCSAAGTAAGIRILAARSVTIDKVTVRGFPGAGIAIAPTADGTTVVVRDSHLSDNCTAGLDARRPGGSARVTLLDSFVTNNPTGVRAGAGAAVRIARNTVTANATGLAYDAGGVLSSNGDNRVAGNVADGSPTPAPAPAPAPSGGAEPGAPTPPAAPAAAPCIVPKVTGLRYAPAVRKLYAAGCRPGTVRYRYSRKHRRYRMYRQDVRAGAVTAPQTQVRMTISAKRPKARPPRASVAVTGGEAVTWISGVGDDANPTCARIAPCKTLAGAVTQTADGGTINALDPVSGGTLTVTQPVTIDGGANLASVLGFTSANGIVINAGPAADVTLRNLTIEYGPSCTAPGVSGSGIRIISAHVVRLENVVIRGFPNAGVLTDPTSAAHVIADHSTLTGNCTAGIAAAGAPTDVTVLDSSVSGSVTGVTAGDGATVRLGGNQISGNTTAFARTGTGVLQSWGDELLGNTADGATPDALAAK
ncbi:MAG: right-handed parallel beta-helix repeat-containing protein [Solirubrobacteraceae bacterium]